MASGTKIIAVAGKGGVGKTTICGMLVRSLIANGKKPLLVVDADPNSNLNEVLGIDVEISLGSVREEIAHSEMAEHNPIPAGVSKGDYAEMRFSDALVEEQDFDFLAMGHPEGKGCYCYVNSLLTTQINKYLGNYKFMLVDNEAGLEHVSRGVLPHIDILILVSDSSRRGVQAAGRVAEIVKDLELKPGMMGLIVNRAPGGEISEGVKEEISKFGLDLIGVLPQDENVYEYDSEGRPSSTVPEDSPIKTALNNIMKNIDFS